MTWVVQELDLTWFLCTDACAQWQTCRIEGDVLIFRWHSIGPSSDKVQCERLGDEGLGDWKPTNMLWTCKQEHRKIFSKEPFLWREFVNMAHMLAAMTGPPHASSPTFYAKGELVDLFLTKVCMQWPVMPADLTWWIWDTSCMNCWQASSCTHE